MASQSKKSVSNIANKSNTVGKAKNKPNKSTTVITTDQELNSSDETFMNETIIYETTQTSTPKRLLSGSPTDKPSSKKERIDDTLKSDSCVTTNIPTTNSLMTLGDMPTDSTFTPPNDLPLNTQAVTPIDPTHLHSMVMALEPVLRNIVRSEMNKSVEPLKKIINEQQIKITQLEEKVELLSKKVQENEMRHDNLEGYGRRINLRFDNVTIQNIDNFNSDDIIMDIINNKMGVNISLNDIQRCHPIGPVRNGVGNHFIVRFLSYRTRCLILKNRKNLRGHHVFVNEDLTRDKYKVLKNLKAARKAGKIAAVWTYDGSVFYKNRINDDRVQINNLSQMPTI